MRVGVHAFGCTGMAVGPLRSRMSNGVSEPGRWLDAEGLAAAQQRESRVINRIPVRLAVSRKGRSALLGRTRDISLQGVFIETSEPFDIGATLPLVIELERGQFVFVQAEVVRVTAEGMGLRFHKVDRESARRLRRWVVDHTSVAGSRRQYEQLHDQQTLVQPIVEPGRVRELLEDIRKSGARATLVPASRMARDHACLVAVEPEAIIFRGDEASVLTVGEEVHVLVTLAFVSWAFGVVVTRVDGRVAHFSWPGRIVFSERRHRDREPAPAGATVSWPSPVDPGQMLSFPLLDTSRGGFAFRAPATALLTPGTRISGATLQVGGKTRGLETAEVRHVRRREDDSGSWLRVGVATTVATGQVKAGESFQRQSSSAVGKLFNRVRTAVSVVFSRGRDKLGAGTEAGSRRVVVRSEGLPIVGVLDRTTESDERLKAPLVIVIPGFAGRKEQLSMLAGIIVDGFQRQNADVAVLRIDTTNNLGESGKDPGCDGDGLHCMHHTVSGVIADVKATLAWARRNPFVDPTHIIVVSMSLASIGVRHVMTLPEAADVSLWFSYMGAADAIDTIKNASGNIDFHAYWLRGEKVGHISVNGVMTDGDFFWHDLHAGGHGYLDAAKADMARIKSDIVWLRGAWDAFVDPRRVDAIMKVPAQGGREIIDVQSGHLPRTSDEALEQFIGVTRRIWQHVHHAVMPKFSTSPGKLLLKHDAEWKSVRRQNIADRASWWRDYLLDDDGPGFDIVEFAPEYVAFMEAQADLALGSGGAGMRVLELGAGTGNLTRRLLRRGAQVVATDLVAEALERLKSKVSAEAGQLQVAVVDLEGSPWLAWRRFMRGDLGGLEALAERTPGFQRSLLAELTPWDGDELRAALRGFDVDVSALANKWRLGVQATRLLADCHLVARVVAGREDESGAAARLLLLPPSVFAGRRGLPFPDASFDAVALSLVLSYVDEPSDCISEIHRVLKPGGRLMLSSMVRDAESSKMYLDLLQRLDRTPDSELPAVPDIGAWRERMKQAARRFADQAAELYRIEEEGLFRFYDGRELRQVAACRGFVDARIDPGFGDPPQAVIVTCIKP